MMAFQRGALQLAKLMESLRRSFGSWRWNRGSMTDEFCMILTIMTNLSSPFDRQCVMGAVVLCSVNAEAQKGTRIVLEPTTSLGVPLNNN